MARNAARVAGKEAADPASEQGAQRVARMALGMGGIGIVEQRQEQRDADDDHRERADRGVDPEPDLLGHLDGEGGIMAEGEHRGVVVLERGEEGDHRGGEDRRPQERQEDPAEGLHVVAPEVERRLHLRARRSAAAAP